jgi:hypothetical protein
MLHRSWSDAFSDFLARCLCKKPEERATAAELLEHAFIRDAVARMSAAGGRSELLHAVAKKALPAMEKAREEDAEMEEDEEAEEEDGEAEAEDAADPSSSAAAAAAAGVGGRTIRYLDGTVLAGGTLRRLRGATRGRASDAHGTGPIVSHGTGPISNGASAAASGSGAGSTPAGAGDSAAGVPSFLRDLRASKDPSPEASPRAAPQAEHADPLRVLPEAEVAGRSAEELRGMLIKAGEAFRERLARLSSLHHDVEEQLNQELRRRAAKDKDDAGGADSAASSPSPLAEQDDQGDSMDEEEGSEEDDGDEDDSGSEGFDEFAADAGVARTFRYSSRH